MRVLFICCVCVFCFVCHFFLATSNVNCEETKRILGVLSTEIDTWPTWLQEIIKYVGTAAFIFPVMMIVW